MEEKIMKKESAFGSFIVVFICIAIIEVVLSLLTGKSFNIAFVLLETLPFWIYFLMRKVKGNALTIIVLTLAIIVIVLLLREKIVYYFRIGAKGLIPMSIRIVLQCFCYIVANVTARS